MKQQPEIQPADAQNFYPKLLPINLLFACCQNIQEPQRQLEEIQETQEMQEIM